MPMAESMIDYVLVYRRRETPDQRSLRQRFEKAITADNLCFEKEVHGDYIFMKVHVPFSRIAREADTVKLEMPLTGCRIEKELSLMERLLRPFVTDEEDDYVSAPFEVEKAKLYKGIEDKRTFFSSAQRGFLCHHILINTDINSKNRADNMPVPVTGNYVDSGYNGDAAGGFDNNDHDDPDAVKKKGVMNDDLVVKEGLLYLLMKRAYTDAFTLHDLSADDPIYKSSNKDNGSFVAPVPPELKTDARRDLNRTWPVFWKFQPMWKIRNYFGEKIAFYFAWVGTLLTLIWVPSIVGVCLFFYGIFEALQLRGMGFTCEDLTDAGNATTASPSTATTTERTSGLVSTFVV